ncbi:MAG: hypothetical protein H0U57_13995 [Tatlockia sp.]|nr:hypothetical protein [Tatlockia sp.]
MINKSRLNDIARLDVKAKLHPEIFTILYEHRRYIKSVFLEIYGLYEICHFAITVINPSKEIIVFSATPNIEFNLIKRELWQDDICFSPEINSANKLCWWDLNQDESFSRKIKLENNSFTQGFTIPRKIDNFYFLYSFATKSFRTDLYNYYDSNCFGLIDLGDYFFKSIKHLYSSYYPKQILPELSTLFSKSSKFSTNSSLKLVVANK